MSLTLRAPPPAGEPARSRQHLAEVAVDQVQHGLLVGLLHGRGIVHIGLVGVVAGTHRAEPANEFAGEIATLAPMPMSSQPHGVDQPRVHPECAFPTAEQGAEIEPRGIAVRRHTHHAVLPVEHPEAEVLGDGAVDAGKRVRIVELAQDADVAALAGGETRRRVLALAVDAENRGVAGEAGQVVGARCMGDVVRHRFEPGARPVDAEFAACAHHPGAIAAKAPVAVEDRIERAVGRVPVPARVMPAAAIEKPDAGIRERHRVDVCRTEARFLQAIARRLEGHAAVGVLDPDEALLLGGGDDLAVGQEGGRGVVTQCAGQAQDDQGLAIPGATSSRASDRL